MKFQGAVVREQGVSFAIVIVKKALLDGPASARDDFRDSYHTVFPGVPIILMTQDSRGVPTYQGRKDIVNFLANIDMNRIPWKEYELR